MVKKYQKSSGSSVDWVEEESYFFKLSAWSKKLLKFIKIMKNFILPSSRKNEVVKFVEKGLKDLSVVEHHFLGAYQFLKIKNMLFMFG